MILPRLYTDEDCLKIYKYIVTENKEAIETYFPELIKLTDKLYQVLNIYFKKYIFNSSSRHEMLDWVSGIISFINITNNKEFILNDDITDILGKPSYFNFCDYVNKYISIFYPEDMVKRNINIYVSEFYNVVRYKKGMENIVDNKINNNIFSNNPRLMKLLTVLKDLYNNHIKLCIYSYYSFIMMLIVSYCYYNDIDYNIVYNYLDNPDYYLEKLDLNGFLKICIKNSYYLWYKDGERQVFLKANELFRENKLIIK